MKRALTIIASGLTAAALVVPQASSTAAPAAQGKDGKDKGHGAAIPSYTPPAPTWGECASARLRAAGGECALLEVPLDDA